MRIGVWPRSGWWSVASNWKGHPRYLRALERRLHHHFFPDLSVPRYGWWCRLVLRRWKKGMGPPGIIGRRIRISPHLSGFSVTINNKWNWSILGPMSAWYYHTRPMRLKPLDLTIDFGEE